MQELIYSVIRRDLADGLYLEYETKAIDWSDWFIPFLEVKKARIRRCAPLLEERCAESVETLLALIETFVAYMAINGTYIGNVELQLALHSLIMLRFEPAGTSLGSTIEPLLRELAACSYVKSTVYENTYNSIMAEVIERFRRMHTPVLDGKLVYGPGKVMGCDAPNDW